MDWFNVKSCLPKPFVSVLCYIPGDKPLPTFHEGFMCEGGVWYCDRDCRGKDKVTHWTEMPTFPGDDENEN